MKVVKQNKFFRQSVNLSILVPVYNEEGNIHELVLRIHNALSPQNIKYEIIFIDDHSSDSTVKTITSLSSKYPVKIYSKIGVKGKAQSIIEGFKYAKGELLVMIDGDLQYPPESIPKMYAEIKKGSDVVIANRTHQQISFLRKFTHHGFMFFFAKVLHGLSYDVQSGLKVFRKELTERITLNPTPWTFDLEFLIKARHAGYKISSINIVFEKRFSGHSKLPILKSIFEIGIGAIKMKFKNPEIIPLTVKQVSKEGFGFHYKGQRYTPYSNLENGHSALLTTTTNQVLLMVLVGLFVISSLLINWHFTLIVIIGFLTVIYFTDILFNFFLIYRSFTKNPQIEISQMEIKSRKKWPTYTILCPLYKEWQIIPQFIKGINNLNYPKDRLQVLLLLEEDDKLTIEKVKEMTLPKFIQTIIIPNSIPKTKPKACNYGLNYSKGEYVVIYDAEDMPEPDQLKKAVLAFDKVDSKTFCIQAKLNFYNPRQNILTRLFTTEYSLWFDLVLTGLQSFNTTIPLGGTSNHFRKKDLIHLKGWDAFNVTEDCDLGIRLVKQGYKTAILDSTTFEEANSQFKNWFWQRTRWIKGYMQTYLVHMRDTKLFSKSGSSMHLWVFQLVVGGKVLSVLINPLMWIITISYFTFRSSLGPFIESFFPTQVFYMGVFSMVFGNFLYLYYYMVGLAKKQYYDLIKYCFLIPFYWLVMSAAAWVAIYKLVISPHHWSKTLHGLHLTPNLKLKPAKLYEKNLKDPNYLIP